jgi:hypothetical protein
MRAAVWRRRPEKFGHHVEGEGAAAPGPDHGNEEDRGARPEVC